MARRSDVRPPLLGQLCPRSRPSTIPIGPCALRASADPKPSQLTPCRDECPDRVDQGCGSWAVGHEDSFTETVRVARSTSTIWPWMPRHSWRSPSGPGTNQNCLLYQPPVSTGSESDAAKAPLVSGSSVRASL